MTEVKAEAFPGQREWSRRTRLLNAVRPIDVRCPKCDHLAGDLCQAWTNWMYGWHGARLPEDAQHDERWHAALSVAYYLDDRGLRPRE